MKKKEILEVLGTGLVFGLLVAALAFVLAQYTSIGGGVASIGRPFSPVRNELAYTYTAVGAGLGFVIGGLVGHSKKKEE